MNALGIIGIVFAALVFLFFLLLLIPVRLVFLYDGEKGLQMRVKVLFLTFGGEKEPKKEVAPPTSQEPKKKSPMAERVLRFFRLSHTDADGKKRPMTERLSEAVDLLRLVFGRLTWLLKRVQVKSLRASVVCGGEDASDAAMDYGRACAVLYPLVGYLCNTGKLKKNHTELAVSCDFSREEGEFELYAVLSLRVIFAARAVFYIVRKQIGKSLKGEAKA